MYFSFFILILSLNNIQRDSVTFLAFFNCSKALEKMSSRDGCQLANMPKQGPANQYREHVQIILRTKINPGSLKDGSQIKTKVRGPWFRSKEIPLLTNFSWNLLGIRDLHRYLHKRQGHSLVISKSPQYPNVCRVVCGDFAATYGKHGVVFPCWYSQLDSTMVITDLDIQEASESTWVRRKL